MPAPDTSPDVLICGAGPVGLALAVELGSRGVRCVVVEQHDRVGYNPRAKLVNVRSREHFRRWGIAEALDRASPLPPDDPSDIVFVTRLTGPMLARIENAFNCSRERNDLYSQEAKWIAQYHTEEVLRARAASLPGVTLRFNARLEHAEQSAEAVRGTVVDTRSGERTEFRAAFLVGADGSRSTVRERIGARMEGDASISRNVNLQFRAPGLAALHPHGPAVQYWTVNPDVPCLMGPMDTGGLWFLIATRLGETSDPERTDPRELVRLAVGMDFPFEVEGSEIWVAHRLIAERYRDARMLLAGDACHLHPPMGGFGMNMGIGDAVDLGWKLAAVLQGWGGPRLLDSYEAERRPVHRRTIDEAVSNYARVGSRLWRPGLEDPGPLGDATRREVGELVFATKLREFKTLGMVLGYSYAGSPLVRDDGSAPPVEHPMIYEPSAHPGCLAPHLWLADGSSLYDRFGAGFTLLCTEAAAEAQAEPLRSAAAERGVPLRVIAPGDVRLPPRYRARMALIRPDQHVAWRGDTLPRDCGALLDTVRGAAR